MLSIKETSYCHYQAKSHCGATSGDAGGGFNQKRGNSFLCLIFKKTKKPLNTYLLQLPEPPGPGSCKAFGVASWADLHPPSS